MLRASPLFLLTVLVLVAFLPVVSPEAEAAASFKPVYHQTGFGIDLGTITRSFTSNGFAFWDNWTPQTNMSFKLPVIAGVTMVLSQLNSSTYGYHLSGSIAGHAVVADLLFTIQGYNTLVILRGTITGLSGNIAFSLPFAGANSLRYNTGNCNVGLRHLSFDWCHDVAASSWNNSTKTLTFNIGSSFNIDPIALDGSNRCSADPQPCSASITTANANDVIIVVPGVSSGSAGGCPDFSAPTSSPSLTFTQRTCKFNGQFVEVAEYYSTWSSSGSITITCNLGVSVRLSCNMFAISGADTSTIFDSGAGCTASASSPSSVLSCSFTTTNANDMILGMGANQGDAGANPTPGGGYTMIQGAHDARGSVSSDYLIVSATGSQTPIYNLAASENWAFIGDAVKQSSGGVTTTVTTSVTTAFTTTFVGSTSVASTTTTTECFHGSQTVTSTSTFPSTTTVTYTTTYTTGTITSTTTTTVGATASVTIVVSTSFGVSSIVSVSTQNSVSVDTALIVSCGGSGGAVKADPPSYLWLLLIPVAFLIALIARRRT